MDTFSVGDKVKFLNASGGGVVVKVIDSRTVSVLIEDGFEIPTMISELIKMNPSVPAARFFDEHFKVAAPQAPGTTEEPADERIVELPKHIREGRQNEEIFLAFVPHDQKWMITGMVDVLLVNSTNFDVLYNIFSKTPIGHYNGVDYGSIFPGSSLLLDTINREQLTHWTEGCFQFLFHRQQFNIVIPPFNSEFRIEGKKFFKEGNYRTHPLIQGKGIVIRLVSLTDYLKESVTPHQAAAQSEQPVSEEQIPLIRRFAISPQEAVVDLHIHELIDDPVNLEKSEILDFQIDFFLKCLDSAKAQHFTKVIFIHGVGNGVLRERITGILSKTEGIEFFDAPMSKYGVGAMDVRLFHNS